MLYDEYIYCLYLDADLFDGAENDVEVLKTNTHGVVFEMGQSLSAHIVHQTTVNYCILSSSHYSDQNLKIKCHHIKTN